MIITFVGHSTLVNHNEIEDKLKLALKDYLTKKERTYFYCGGYGAFDELCASVCRQLKKEYPNTEIVYVTPYISLSHQEKMNYLIHSKLYDSTIYPPIENVPPKYAILRRNEWMIDRADIVISYVTHNHGGAYKSLQFARKKKKDIIELCD